MDQAFVLKAASGGVMEVEAGRIAQENASSQRVKDFGAMMVRDHGMANQELMSIASAKGMMIPQDSLMTVHQKHLDEMKKMKGAAFDKHYISMMKDGHNKDIAEFEKASTGATDADIKGFATKTLPTLRTHKDSVQAISAKN
jgi:putative membrane protein